MLEVTDLDVVVGGEMILKRTSLQVDDGEILGVLGPSGSGKTTLLRAVAGLAEVAAGDVKWDDVSVIGKPTHERGFGLMFQGYALFPHLDVSENVGFGLRMAHHPSDQLDTKVSDALAWVGLAGFERRTIDSLSGGESQRVALARTLAPSPRLVMLDEPLGALDRNLREKLVAETREILEGRGVTAIVVTHDRDEAARLSDRLALMRDGTIVQTGSLSDLLANPASEWVHDFLG